jgi:Bromodomain
LFSFSFFNFVACYLQFFIFYDFNSSLIPIFPSISGTEAPEYEFLVPVNIHLTLMRERACNCHYRQPQSFLADARTVCLNAVLYNGEGSAIALRVGCLQLTFICIFIFILILTMIVTVNVTIYIYFLFCLSVFDFVF